MRAAEASSSTYEPPVDVLAVNCGRKSQRPALHRTAGRLARRTVLRFGCRRGVYPKVPSPPRRWLFNAGVAEAGAPFVCNPSRFAWIGACLDARCRVAEPLVTVAAVTGVKVKTKPLGIQIQVVGAMRVAGGFTGHPVGRSKHRLGCDLRGFRRARHLPGRAGSERRDYPVSVPAVASLKKSREGGSFILLRRTCVTAVRYASIPTTCSNTL